MPNIKGAVKRVKQSEKRRLHNASQKSAIRTAMKMYRLQLKLKIKKKRWKHTKSLLKSLTKQGIKVCSTKIK